MFGFWLESVRVVEFGFVLSVVDRGLDLGGYGKGFSVSLEEFDRVSSTVTVYVSQWVCGVIVRWVVACSYK